MLPLRDRLPSRTVPFVTYGLIAVNVLAFVWQEAVSEVAGDADLVLSFGLVPRAFVRAPVAHATDILTSMFMHGGWAHLLGNMWFLWIFGDNVEDAIGHARYVAFYLLGGLGAAAAQILVDPSSQVPMVGASGAISGVLAAYLSLYPSSPITILNPVPLLWFVFGLTFELPAWLIVIEWFIGNLFGGFSVLGVRGGGGVAFWAHIGGFVAGLVLVRVFMAGRERRAPERWTGWRSPPRRPPPSPWGGGGRGDWRGPPGGWR